MCVPLIDNLPLSLTSETIDRAVTDADSVSFVDDVIKRKTRNYRIYSSNQSKTFLIKIPFSFPRPKRSRVKTVLA